MMQHRGQPLSLVTNKASLSNNRTNEWNLCHFNSVIMDRLIQCRISTNEGIAFNRKHNVEVFIPSNTQQI